MQAFWHRVVEVGYVGLVMVAALLVLAFVIFLVALLTDDSWNSHGLGR